MKGLVKKSFKRLKNHFRKIIKIKKSPHSIALGFAIGTFISILPTPGLNILIGLLVVLVYKNVNKFSLFGAIVFWNTLTMAPIYFLSYKVGNLFFGSAPVVNYNLAILNKIYYFSRRFLVGSFIMAVFVSSASYVLIRLFLINYHNKTKKIKK